MPHDIKYPVRAKSYVGDEQWLIVDADGQHICVTLAKNDEANAKFIADAINEALRPDFGKG